MFCTVILCNLNLMFAVIMRRLYIRLLLGGEQAIQLATLLRPIWLWWIFIFFKGKKKLPTGFYLPHSNSSLSVPTAPFELGNMAWPMVFGT